jgi:hypothetical protein
MNDFSNLAGFTPGLPVFPAKSAHFGFTPGLRVVHLRQQRVVNNTLFFTPQTHHSAFSHIN